MKLGRLSWQENSTELDGGVILFFQSKLFCHGHRHWVKLPGRGHVHSQDTHWDVPESRTSLCTSSPMEGICHLCGCWNLNQSPSQTPLWERTQMWSLYTIVYLSTACSTSARDSWKSAFYPPVLTRRFLPMTFKCINPKLQPSGFPGSPAGMISPSSAECVGSIPGWGTKILHDSQAKD